MTEKMKIYQITYKHPKHPLGCGEVDGMWVRHLCAERRNHL